MQKYSRRLFIIQGMALLIGCSSGDKKDHAGFDFPQLKNTQYLLTNEINMKNRRIVCGASAYLLELNGVPYLATAKHLTTDAMGFDPPIDLKTYSDSVNYWYGYPRTKALTNEKIETESLLYHDDVMEDVILLKLKRKPIEIAVFKPNFKRLNKGDRVSVIGCEYTDPDCNQKQFFGTFQQYTMVDQMEIFMDSSSIILPGMSGTPIVDEEFRVVGHVMGGMVGEKGILKLYCAPIDWVNRIKK